MNICDYPPELQSLLNGMHYEEDSIGRSTAGVYRYFNDKISYYLKVQPSFQGLGKEKNIMEWLQHRLLVPEIIYFKSYNDLDYLLMSEIQGEMLCSDYFLDNPEKSVRLLADGIKMLQSIPIEDCPFDNNLNIKLEEALFNIENNLVDMDDWEENNRFETPLELFEYLKQNQPKESSLSFTHGDYSLPNIFGKDNKISGFIDLGRGGIADIYQDIALCVRSLKHNYETEDYTGLFFRHLGIQPNCQKVEYYILLDELF
ncbi:MAG: aminoglycoside 3'-phosphotransferase [Tissierella sp.]|nr:aminoglycoside 3'-phosphotransferase [Tissierella sp.]